MCDAIRVAVSGAGSEIGYALVYMIARGDVFGPKQDVILHLLDTPDKANLLDATSMELKDCLMPTLRQVIPTSDATVAFIAAACAFLIGPTATREGNERKEIIAENLKVFKSHGQAINQYACKDVKVVVIGVVANTNALICSHYAPSVPRENFTALTRLHQSRALGILAEKVRMEPDAINNVVVWGNNSSTIFPDAGSATVTACGQQCCIYDVLDDDVYLQAQFISEVQNRDTSIRAKRQGPAAMSLAKAACEHMRDWWYDTEAGKIISMGVITDGSYCIPKDIFFSMPVEVVNGTWSIVQGMPIDDFAKSKMALSAKEIVEEKAEAVEACRAECLKKEKPEEECSSSKLTS